MKNVLIAMAVACVGMCAAQAGSLTPYADLQFRTNAWFSKTVNAQSGGEVTSQAQFTPADGKLMFNENEAGAPVVFTVSEDNQRTNDITTVAFDVVASTIPNGKQKTIDTGVAVALYETSASAGGTNFIAWTGASWVPLASDVIPADGSEYTLVIRFDDRDANAKKVKFAAVIDHVEHALKSGNEEWLAYTGTVGARLNVGFRGDGALTQFGGEQLVVLSEVITTGDGAVDVNETDAKAFANELNEGETLADYMAANAATRYNETKGTKLAANLTIAQAYALGLITSKDGAVEFPSQGVLAVKAGSTAVTDAGVKVSFVNVTPNTASGAGFSYQLQSWSDQKQDWVNEGDPVTDYSAIVIPRSAYATGAKHYFKVVTTVTLKGGN